MWSTILLDFAHKQIMSSTSYTQTWCQILWTYINRDSRVKDVSLQRSPNAENLISIHRTQIGCQYDESRSMISPDILIILRYFARGLGEKGQKLISRNCFFFIFSGMVTLTLTLTQTIRYGISWTVNLNTFVSKPSFMPYIMIVTQMILQVFRSQYIKVWCKKW